MNILGAGQQQTTTGSVHISESSSNTQNSQSSASHGQISPILVGSTGSGLVTNEVVTGGQQSRTTSGGSSSLTPNHISGSGTLIGNETVSSGTGVSAGTITQGQQQQRGSDQHNLQSGTGSSSQVNTEVAGSNMSAVQQSSSSHWNHMTGVGISTGSGHRRSGVCQAAVHTAYCLFEAYAMYAYDSYSGTCFMIYDCSLYGNKFPTLEACKRTCIRGGRQPQLHAPDIQKILNLTRPSTEMVQSSVKGTQISQRPSGPAQVPSLPGGTHISGSQGKLNTSMQQTTSAQSTVISSTGTSVGQTETGSTSQQASGQGQISGGQVATQSSGGGGATVTQSAQENRKRSRGGDG
uniref:Putative bovine pancreatic trypsin inhibitor n=1 Tax=Rhipicephalus microplus TaxID=6941 RepID=A0A6G5A709_RHIMP